MQAYQIGEIPHRFAFTEGDALIHYKYAIVLSVPVPAQAGWATEGWIAFGSAWADVRLRHSIHDGTTWSPDKNINITGAGNRHGQKLPDAAYKISIGRVKTSATDTADDVPASWLLQYQVI